MSLATPLVMDGNLARQSTAGDVLNLQEVIQDINNAAGVTWTAQQMLTGLIGRRGAAAVTDTTADANSIVNALLGAGQGFVGGGATTPAGLTPGATFRLRVASGNSGTLTIAAGAGVTLVTTYLATNVSATAMKDYLVTVLNGTPTVIIGNCATTNASAVVTGMTAAQTSSITPGMAVSGTGIAGGATVLSVQSGVGFTLSANATATTNPVALTFTPRVSLTAIS